MTKITKTIALLAGFAAFAPLAANAAPFFTPHDQLVREINHAYGTQFKTQSRIAPVATAHDAGAPHRG